MTPPRRPEDPAPAASRPWFWAARAALSAMNGTLRIAERLAWPLAPRRTAKVAVFRVGMIGDVLVSLPALEAVRRAHPDAELVLVGSPGRRGMPGAAELLGEADWIDRQITYHAEDVADRHGQLRLLRRLRAERFDRVYVLPPELTPFRTELRNLAFLRAAGARWVRGFAVHNARCLPERLAAAHHAGATFQPEWRRQLELLGRRAGLSTADPEQASAPLPRPERCVEAVDALSDELGLFERPLLALAPGAKLVHKRWSPASFGAVARAWIDAGGQVCVLGGPGDVQLAAEVAAAADRDLTVLCGRTDLLASAEVLRRAAALVSNDTGTMHLGASVGVPLVALFSGSNRPVVWHPWAGGPQRILRHEVGCSPCFDAECPFDAACLRGIAPSRVESSLCELGVWPGQAQVDAALPGAAAAATVDQPLGA